MKLLRNRKKQQRRRNLLLAGAGIGGLGLVVGGVALARRPRSASTPPRSSVSTAQPRAITSVNPSTKVSSVRSRRQPNLGNKRPRSSQLPRFPEARPKAVIGGAMVHIPGLGKTYYPSSPLVELNVRLGKPGGRARSRKNWNDWDRYRNTHPGAYGLRNTRRYDKGRF